MEAYDKRMRLARAKRTTFSFRLAKRISFQMAQHNYADNVRTKSTVFVTIHNYT